MNDLVPSSGRRVYYNHSNTGLFLMFSIFCGHAVTLTSAIKNICCNQTSRLEDMPDIFFAHRQIQSGKGYS